ncbi:hypothetical protein [Caballeronia choica]|uniref:hypothetical protein n=1 Tax=Caballeronia choica TaxID=326476 RepID=UPI000F73FF44|nr:hypothetical protein [Caballeronia choica]
MNEGILFRCSPRQRDDSTADAAEENDTERDEVIDLAIALRKFEELGMEDEGSGYAYWRKVGQLLKRAADMQAEIALLDRELERCRAMLPKSR